MADSKITALTAISTVDPTADPLVIVDVSDTSMAASGTTKKSTINQLLGAGGTATLASATITGDLTVSKNTNGQNRLILSNPNTGTGAYDTIDFTAGTASNQILSMGSGYSGSFPYLTGALLLRSAQANGIVLNTSGSAAAIQFGINDTLGMTLNSTGLGVGASPRSKLDVNGGLLVNNYVTSTNYAPLSVTTASAITTPSTFTNAISIYNPTTVGAYSNITFGYNALGITNAGAYIGYVSTSSAGFGKGDLVFGTRDVTTDTAATERLRIDAAGQVGIGVTPSAWGANYKAFQIGAQSCLYNALGYITSLNTNAYENSSGQIVRIANGEGTRYVQAGGSHQWFYAANASAGTIGGFTQAMTLDASGNLAIGATATGTRRLEVKSAGTSNTTFAAHFRDSADTLLFHVRSDGYFNTGQGALSPYNNITASAANMFVDSSGFVYRSTSSLKYKTDVKDSVHGLADVLKLRPVTYKSKNGDNTIFGGLIAEEVHAAGLTEFVAYAPDNTPDAIHYSNMVSLLVSAIKELTARVQTLETR